MNLVVGATGDLGRSIAIKLLERSERTRVLVRPQSDYRELKAAGAEVVFGDLKDPASLQAALKGVTTLLCTATATQRGGPDSIETVDRQGVAHLIEAASKAGIDHFIYVSAIGLIAPLLRPSTEPRVKTKHGYRRAGYVTPFCNPCSLWKSGSACSSAANFRKAMQCRSSATGAKRRLLFPVRT